MKASRFTDAQKVFILKQGPWWRRRIIASLTGR
jgi:hypothetical protein